MWILPMGMTLMGEVVISQPSVKSRREMESIPI